LFAAAAPTPDTTTALAAIAKALGRCATPEGERTLRAWLALEPVIARAAALALGKLGTRRGRLGETSLVALLDAAGRGEAPLDEALYAFTRLSPPEGALGTRVLEVARAAAARSSLGLGFAIRAAGRAGSAGVPLLGEWLANRVVAATLRAEAARELGHL